MLRNICLTFAPEQLAILDRALAQMPYGQVAPLIAEINRQIAAQNSCENKASDA